MMFTELGKPIIAFESYAAAFLDAVHRPPGSVEVIHVPLEIRVSLHPPVGMVQDAVKDLRSLSSGLERLRRLFATCGLISGVFLVRGISKRNVSNRTVVMINIH